MKNNILKTVLCLIFFFSAGIASAIEIELTIDKNYNCHISRENKPLIREGIYELSIGKEEVISFLLTNNSDSAFVKVQKKDPKSSLTEFVITDLFTKRNPVQTNTNQRLMVGDKFIDLNQEFVVFLGSNGSMYSATFAVTYQTSATTISTNPTSVTASSVQKVNSTQEPAQHPFIPGCAVTDAIALNTPNYLTEQQLTQLFLHYFPDAHDKAAVIAKAKSNDFLKDEIDQLYNNYKPVKEATDQSDGITSALSLSSIGGLDVTSLADGFAKFIVKRTKQELSIAFFDKMKKELDSYQYRDLRSLFPQTYSLLSTIGTDIYNYQRYIENLREAYIADMDDLVTNLPSIIKNHPEFFNTPEHKELAVALNSACYVAAELKNQSHPGDILANYPVNYLQDLDKDYPAAAVQTLQLINTSMRKAVSKDDEESDYWVDIKQIRNMVNDKKAFKIYLGLLYQQVLNNYGDIVYDSGSKTSESITVMNALKKIADNYDKTSNDYQAYKQYILQFAQKTQAMNTMIKSYKGLSLNDSSAVEAYAKYFNSAIDLIEYSTTASELPYIKDTRIGNLHETLQPYFEISYKVADVAVDINRKNYAGAINNAVVIYNLVKSRKEILELEAKTNNTLSDCQAKRALRRGKRKIKKLDPAVQEAKRKELDKKIEAGQNNYPKRKVNEEKLDSLTQVLQKLMQYGAFFATVAECKTSDEVANAIETFALPTGSFRIKKESAFNVSLNAYCGFYYGHEGIKPFDLQNKHVMNAYGITAPIGIAASIGIKKCSSLSVFASIIDLGAVTAFRFENDTTTTIAKIELRDIISPGVFISWGLPKIPISLNVGYQMTPLLQTVSASANGYAPATSRISIGLCVDIPVLNLYTKTRK